MERLFCDKLGELYQIYMGVKRAIILAENFNPKQEMYIAPINELRSTLDHIFKALDVKNSNVEYELKEAKEHMERAGYDALELLVGSLGVSVVKKLRKYDEKTLTEVFPDYFRSIKPQITDIKSLVTEFRSERKVDLEKSFLDYFEQIEKLVLIDKDINRMIPALEEYMKKRKKRNWHQILMNIIYIILGAAIGYLLK